MNVDEYYIGIISSFYSIALCGVVESWLRNSSSTRMSSAELVKMLDITITGNIMASLKKCEGTAEAVKDEGESD